MLCAFGHHVATCCDALRHVGCCWFKFENGQIFHATLVDAYVAWCCSRLARFVQQCCARACALVRFSTRNMPQHVATGWPNARNLLLPKMLRYVAPKYMSRSFGRGLHANTGPTMLRRLWNYYCLKTRLIGTVVPLTYGRTQKLLISPGVAATSDCWGDRLGSVRIDYKPFRVAIRQQRESYLF